MYLNHKYAMIFSTLLLIFCLLPFIAIAQQNADDVKEYVAQAEVFWRARNYSDALALAKKAVRLQPDVAKVASDIPEKRKYYLKEALLCRMEMVRGIRSTADQAESAGKYSEAIRLYKKYLAEAPPELGTNLREGIEAAITRCEIFLKYPDERIEDNSSKND